MNTPPVVVRSLRRFGFRHRQLFCPAPRRNQILSAVRVELEAHASGRFNRI